MYLCGKMALLRLLLTLQYLFLKALLVFIPALSKGTRAVIKTNSALKSRYYYVCDAEKRVLSPTKKFFFYGG